ncbi:GntR family transcriptional regulator [Shimia sp. Alg240-R146]|uniref:GntR family transcriptional regulator n=1 Tax=Shimia sp. Alg240-R146 TaxID=2993449 RepID=UPI0022E90BE9|nr:GntR family transcriptional regulator [Shimia sp. Alg240-R146]
MMSIYDAMRDRLVNGHFKPEQRLKATDLGVEFGCSASAMRETLFRLSTVGLVDFQEQRGFRLPASSLKLQQELTQMRILLECEGVCLSIRFGDLGWEARLTAAHHKLRHIESRVKVDTTDRDTLILWTQAELEFHQTLLEACGSTLLMTMHEMVYQQFRQQLITNDRMFRFVPENIDQHQDIIDAALGRDEELVCKRLITHLSRSLVDAEAAPLNVSQAARRQPGVKSSSR